MKEIDIDRLTVPEKLALLFSKMRLYYALKILVEDNDIIRGGLCGYMEHLYQEERRIGKLPDTVWEKEYERLRKIHALRLPSVDRLLTLYPGLITMEKEEIRFLIKNG